MDDAEKLALYKKQLASDFDVLQDQRDAANEDMRFVNVDGGQWEGFLEDVYENRAKPEFDIVSGPKNRFVGEWNQNRLGVEFKPDGDSTTDDDAELLSDVYRADFRDNSGKTAVDNAVDEMATCGFGAFKIAPEFEDEEDEENENQNIVWEPIHNAYNTVAFDQASKRADKEDARWVTELVPYTKEAFEDQFPGKKPSSAYEPADRSYLNTTASADCIYVAVRREVVKKREKVYIYNNLESGKVERYREEAHEAKKAELKGSDVHEFVRERTITRRSIFISTFSGEEFLEAPRRIAGKWLGIVPVYGYRAYIDGQEWYYGLVRKLKDAGRAFNVQMGQVVENAASSEPGLPIFDRKQVESIAIQQSWNSRNASYRVVDALKDDNGNIVAPGPIAYTQPSTLDPNTALLLQVIPQYMQSEAGQVADSVDPDSSGKAINAMIKRENLNTQILNDNIRNAIAFSGKVYQSIFEDINDIPRSVRTLSKDGTDGRAQLLKTEYDGEKIVEANNLRGKKFRAFADVGPQYESVREQTVEELKGMLDALSQTEAGMKYTPAVISTILENVSGVGLGPLKKMVRRDSLLMGLVEPESDEDKEFLAQQQQPKEDPQQALVEAAANQQNAEAENLRASSLEKAASAELKGAQTQKTLSEIETNEIKTLHEIRSEQLKGLQSLNPQGQRLQ